MGVVTSSDVSSIIYYITCEFYAYFKSITTKRKSEICEITK